jgi:O-acetyl-ADP-ribose deacetylase (regulator of RNase III)
MNREFLDSRVTVKVGDITQEETDAIVNAANSTLLGGGGVDGAIHRRGGNQITEECRTLRQTKYPNGLPTGEAVITGGGNLTAKFVIHTVGPIYGQNHGKDAELLAECYTNCLLVAAENNLQTIAFPSISTGAFAHPKHEAAAVSSQAIKRFLSRHETIQKINLVFFSEPDALKFIKHQQF